MLDNINIDNPIPVQILEDYDQKNVGGRYGYIISSHTIDQETHVSVYIPDQDFRGHHGDYTSIDYEERNLSPGKCWNMPFSNVILLDEDGNIFYDLSYI